MIVPVGNVLVEGHHQVFEPITNTVSHDQLQLPTNSMSFYCQEPSDIPFSRFSPLYWVNKFFFFFLGTWVMRLLNVLVNKKRGCVRIYNVWGCVIPQVNMIVYLDERENFDQFFKNDNYVI